MNIAIRYLKTGKFSITKQELEKLGMILDANSDKEIQEIRCLAFDGARKSAKTLSLYIMYCFLLLFAPKKYNVSIKVYGWYYKNAVESFEEFLKRMKVDFGIDFKRYPYSACCNKKDLKIVWQHSYWNGKENVLTDNEIKFMSCYELQSVSKLGSTRSTDFHTEILFFEEYSKFTDKKYFEDIREAHGGTEEYLECFASNPWTIKHFQIKFFHDLLPYNINHIKKNHYQMTLKNEMVIWHCQWRVNEMLKRPDIIKQEDIERYNPSRARVSCYGEPGIEAGGILSGWASLVNYITFKSEAEFIAWNDLIDLNDGYYQFGMDVGLKHDKSVLYLIKLINPKVVDDVMMYERVVIVKEWSWEPIRMGEDYSYRADDMAQYILKQIIMKFYKELKRFREQLKYNTINFYIDLSAHAMISAMQKALNGADETIKDAVKILPSVRFNYRALANAKHYTKDMMKIQEMRRLLEEDCIYVCKLLDQSLAPLFENNLISWEYKKSMQGKEQDTPSDYNCDGIDGFIYSISDCFNAIGRFYDKGI